MTESEWLACTNPQPMLEFLLRRHLNTGTEMRRVASMAMRLRSGWGRKFRLYACGWSRHFWEEIEDERLRNALDITETYADGLTSDKDFRTAKRQARATYEQAVASQGDGGWGTNVASFVLNVMSLRFMPGWNPHRARESGTRKEDVERHLDELGRFQCSLLRDVFGPLPFRTVTLNPSWLAWNDCTIPELAQPIYDQRAFDRLTVLADTLEVAGCTNADILAHCRSDGPHVRGCWVVDLVLGKE